MVEVGRIKDCSRSNCVVEAMLKNWLLTPTVRESEAKDQVEGIGVWVEQIMLCEAVFELGSSQILRGG